jgi:hypothetical protein
VLGSASLAVHLVAESAGKTCDGATEPMVALQLRRSAEEMARRKELQRLIWLPPDVKPAAGAYADLFKALCDFNANRAPLVPLRDDVVREPFDSFLAQVRRKLRDRSSAEPTGPGLRTASLYVVVADEDVSFARRTLRGQLRDVLGMAVDMPLATDRPGEARELHEVQRLRDADAAVVLWGARGIDWVESQLHKLRQWERLDRTRAFSPIVLLIGGAASAEKDEEDPLAPGEVRIDIRAGMPAVAVQLAQAFSVPYGPS